MTILHKAYLYIFTQVLLIACALQLRSQDHAASQGQDAQHCTAFVVFYTSQSEKRVSHQVATKYTVPKLWCSKLYRHGQVQPQLPSSTLQRLYSITMPQHSPLRTPTLNHPSSLQEPHPPS
jgi:hypothetical protein